MQVRGLAGYTALATAPEIPLGLLQGGGSEGVATVVESKGAQEYRLHPWRTHRIPGLDGKLTIPHLRGQTDLPLLRRVVRLGTLESGHPDRRPRRSQDFLDHAPSPTGPEHMAADLSVLKAPLPLVPPVAPGAGLITTNPAPAAQACEDFRHPLGAPAFDPLAQVGQAPCTDA